MLRARGMKAYNVKGGIQTLQQRQTEREYLTVPNGHVDFSFRQAPETRDAPVKKWNGNVGEEKKKQQRYHKQLLEKTIAETMGVGNREGGTWQAEGDQ